MRNENFMTNSKEKKCMYIKQQDTRNANKYIQEKCACSFDAKSFSVFT